MMTRCTIGGIVAVLTLLPAAANAQEEASPPFSLIRADESYAYLRDPVRRSEGLDMIRYIPVGSFSGAYLSLGGEVRVRVDDFDAARFGLGASDDTYGLVRLLAHADLHLGERVRVYGELGDHLSVAKQPPFSPTDRDRLDLQNLFVDVVVDTHRHLRLRLGRQELQFNPTQRFVSVREGPNLRQSFDGARATWTTVGWRLDAFATRPVVPKAGTFDDSSEEAQAFSGVYVAHSVSSSGSTLSIDAYVFDFKKEKARYGAITNHERRLSYGVRLAGQRGPWDIDWEGVAQTGSFAGRDIRAWGYGLDSGYTFATDWTPRLGLRFDGGSGDRDPDDGHLGTFNPMFPKGAYFNEAALDSFANRKSVRVSLRVKPRPDLVLEASHSSRWRQTAADAVYLQPEIALAGTAGRRGLWVGSTLAFDAVWKATRNLTLTGEMLHQTAGDTIRQNGGRDVDFLMLMAQVRF